MMSRSESVFRNVAKREVMLLLGMKRPVALLIAWSVVLALLLGAIFSAEVVSDLPFVVVDHDRSAFSRSVIRYLDSTRTFEYRGQVESVRDIEDLIHRDEIAFGLVIPHGAIGTIKRGRSARLRAFVNASNLMIANLSYAEIQTISGTMSAGVMIKYLRKIGEEKDMALAHFSPVKSEIYRISNPAYNYRVYLAPGLWISVFHQLLMLAGALVISREVKAGTLSEFVRAAAGERGAGVPAVALAAKLSPYAGLGILLHSLWYFVLLPLTGLHGGSRILAIELLTVLFVAATLSLGLLISASTRGVFNSLKIVILVSSPAFLISGHTWPLNVMPVVVQWIARMIPLTHYLSAFRKIYQEDADLYFVRWEMVALLSIAVMTFLAAWMVFRSRERQGGMAR